MNHLETEREILARLIPSSASSLSSRTMSAGGVSTTPSSMAAAISTAISSRRAALQRSIASIATANDEKKLLLQEIQFKIALQQRRRNQEVQQRQQLYEANLVSLLLRQQEQEQQLLRHQHLSSSSGPSLPAYQQQEAKWAAARQAIVHSTATLPPQSQRIYLSSPAAPPATAPRSTSLPLKTTSHSIGTTAMASTTTAMKTTTAAAASPLQRAPITTTPNKKQQEQSIVRPPALDREALVELGKTLRKPTDPYVDVSQTPVMTAPKNKRKYYKAGQRPKLFPEKLYDLLLAQGDETNDDKTRHLSFLSHGRAFMIFDPEAFEQSLMPEIFKHNKWASFTRQLSLYGFQRIRYGPDEGAFYHELFLEGRPDLVRLIRRSGVPTEQDRRRLRHLQSQRPDPNFYALPPIAAPGATDGGDNDTARSAKNKRC